MKLFIRKKIYKWYKTRLFIRKKRRRGKKLKKHAEKFFDSRSKKFMYYYKKSMKGYTKMESNVKKNQLTYNYKFAIQGLSKKYIKTRSMISLIRMLKIYRRKTDLDKQLAFRIVTYPDFWLTRKAKAVRMGKGKAPLSYAINVFQRGNIFVEWRFLKKIQHAVQQNRLFRSNLWINLFFLSRQLQVRVQTKNLIKINYW